MINIKKLILILIVCMITATLGCTSLGMHTIPLDQLKMKYADAQSQILQIDDINIHYRDEGQGPVLILLHGVCASLHTWDGWAERLKGHYRVIRLDLPGFGLTGPAPDPSLYEIGAGVKMFERIANELHLEKFSVAGNSMGGYISWNYALKHPERVEKLILVDPVGFPQPLPGLIAFASFPIIRIYARFIMPKFIFNTAVSQVFGDQSKVTDKLIDRYFELAMREGNRGATIDIFTLFRKLCNNKNLSAGISELKLPVLVMWGTKDIWTPYTTEFPKWKKELPTAKFIQYEGAGHTPMEEIPDETARDADLFLSGKM